MAPSDTFQRDVRLYIYQQFVETSIAPSTAETAAALSCAVEDVEAAFQALADARHIVLHPGTSMIWMAMPFSNVQTGVTVISGGRAYYAHSAWGAFGIAALLGADSRVFTTCADCGGVLERKISGGAPIDTRGVVHFALPPRQWWDDVGQTSSTILLFTSDEHVDRWCARQGIARGAIVSLAQTWALAKRWYEHRLDLDFRRPTPAEAMATFASVGLDGPFWTVE